MASRSAVIDGSRRVTTPTPAAMYIAEGKESFDD